MEVTDYSVSGETFTLTYEERYALYRTTPVPDDLGSYYQSEACLKNSTSG